ncbi:MAG: DUF4197 domain-containing protein [Pseudomonadota bacterium]
MRIFVVAAAALGLAACETGPTSGLGSVFGDVVSGLGGASVGGLTNAEIDAGLREALTIGTERVSSQLGATDGFFGDDRIRIPLPGRLGELQDQLGKVGLSAPLDDLQLRMNRAAEASMPEARRLVISAVQSITLEDAIGILNGGDTAATDFLRGRTEVSLSDAFRPYINAALADSGSFQTLDSVTSRYGLSAVSNDLRDDMTDHAVSLGLDGVFYYVGQEEQRIRENPVARTTELLRKVFGSV